MNEHTTPPGHAPTARAVEAHDALSAGELCTIPGLTPALPNSHACWKALAWGAWTPLMTRRRTATIKFRKKEMKTHKKCSGGGAHGGCFQDLEICEIKFAQGIWRGPARTFLQFSQQVSSFVRSIAVCSTTCRRDLLLQLLNPYHTISAVTALQAAAQLEVACPLFLCPA